MLRGYRARGERHRSVDLTRGRTGNGRSLSAHGRPSQQLLSKAAPCARPSPRNAAGPAEQEEVMVTQGKRNAPTRSHPLCRDHGPRHPRVGGGRPRRETPRGDTQKPGCLPPAPQEVGCFQGACLQRTELPTGPCRPRCPRCPRCPCCHSRDGTSRDSSPGKLPHKSRVQNKPKSLGNREKTLPSSTVIPRTGQRRWRREQSRRARSQKKPAQQASDVKMPPQPGRRLSG